MLKLGVRVWTWDRLPNAKFCKNRWRGYTPLGKINTKNFKFLRLSYISRHFIPIMLKFERIWDTLGIPQWHKIMSQSLKGYCTGPAGIALPSGGDAYWFLVFLCVFYVVWVFLLVEVSCHYQCNWMHRKARLQNELLCVKLSPYCSLLWRNMQIVSVSMLMLSLTCHIVLSVVVHRM